MMGGLEDGVDSWIWDRFLMPGIRNLAETGENRVVKQTLMSNI